MTLPHFVRVPSQDLDFQRRMAWSFLFVFSELRWEVIVCFVNISGMVAHHCLIFLFIMCILYCKVSWFDMTMQSVPITTNVGVRIPLMRGVLYTTSCDIKLFSDFRQVSGFPRVLRFPPPLKLTTTIELQYC